MRGPRPEGATEDRLLSTNADAFNYATGRHGPVLDGCEFSFQGDDFVNLYGIALPVYRKDNDHSPGILREEKSMPLEEELRPGDTVRVVDPVSYRIKGTATIASIEKGGVETVDWNSLNRIGTLMQPASKRERQSQLIHLVLSKDIPGMQENDLFDIPELCVPDYTIRNCYFHDHRSRGLVLQASNGLVENNRFERIKGQAIAIGPHYAVYREGGWVKNVVIRGNTIDNVGFGMICGRRRTPRPARSAWQR